MQLRRYETLMLAVPEITQDEIKHLERSLDKAIQDGKGKIVSFDRWGKYRLMYPVKRNDYGVYFLIRFDVPDKSQALDEMRTLFSIKLNDIVMRSVFTRLDDDAPVEYQRPKSLEEVPSSREVGSFLKENKVEELISAVDSTADKKAMAVKPEEDAPAPESAPVESKPAEVDKADDAGDQ